MPGTVSGMIYFPLTHKYYVLHYFGPVTLESGQVACPGPVLNKSGSFQASEHSLQRKYKGHMCNSHICFNQ